MTIAYGHYWSFALAPMWAKPIIVTSFLHMLLPSFMYIQHVGMRPETFLKLCVCVCFLKEEMKESKHVLGRLLLHEMTTTRGWRT
jgi:hypothetical protein